MKLFKIEKLSLKNWLKFILIAIAVAGTVVLLGTVVLQFSPQSLYIQTATEPSPNPEVQVVPDVPATPVLETSPEPSEKAQESPAPNSSTQIEPSPPLLQRLPEPAKLIKPLNPTSQNSEVDRGEQKLVASETAYGHFLYPQGHINRMEIIGSYGARQYQRFEYLHPEAAKALMKMIYTARDEGVWLVPVSGFRTVDQQEELFRFQIQRRGSQEAAAKVSAPPGYSEHHTGFAVDLTDGNFPKKDITIDFENTKAFQWLTRRAQEFGFELSFPPNNPQGVSYEPWHWRYIGSPEAAATFVQQSQ